MSGFSFFVFASFFLCLVLSFYFPYVRSSLYLSLSLHSEYRPMDSTAVLLFTIGFYLMLLQLYVGGLGLIESDWYCASLHHMLVIILSLSNIINVTEVATIIMTKVILSLSLSSPSSSLQEFNEALNTLPSLCNVYCWCTMHPSSYLTVFFLCRG